MECSNITSVKFWGKVEWGKDRFVATTNKTDSSSQKPRLALTVKHGTKAQCLNPENGPFRIQQRHVVCSKKRYRFHKLMLLHLVETVSHWDGKILTTANELRAGVVGYAHGNWVVANQ